MVAPNLDFILRRGVAEIIVKEELERLLELGKPLRLKQGFDPSRPDIHLGHVVGLRKLRQFQELGHQVILIVGDWTAQIGDPSGESATRPMLSAEEVRANAETYMKQFFKVVDRERTQVLWQSEWFGKFNLADVIRLTSKFTVAQFLAREDFNKRFTAGRPIAITELLYPLLQAYDSIVIEADVEFGGTDQKFNCLVGRELQSMMGQRPQQIFLVPLLLGTDGSQKMSKSLGNYIGIDEPPNNMYGKVMSLKDELIMDYFVLLTDVPDEELQEFRRALEARSVNPMELKKRLAREIVAQFHGQESAVEAEEHFERTYQRRELPEKVKTYPFRITHDKKVEFKLETGTLLLQVYIDPSTGRPGTSTADIVHGLGLAKSKSEAHRLIAQGAVEINGQKWTEEKCPIEDGTLFRVGKTRFAWLIKAPPELE